MPSPTGENHAICMREAQSARQLVLQETASASAATYTSEPLGTGRGEDGYCGGKSDVQAERQRPSSEVIGRTSDSVHCSTARRDGEQSNHAPVRPGARTSPCCEAASWVQGSRPGNPGHPVTRGVVPSHSSASRGQLFAERQQSRHNAGHGARSWKGKGRRMLAATP